MILHYVVTVWYRENAKAHVYTFGTFDAAWRTFKMLRTGPAERVSVFPSGVAA